MKRFPWRGLLYLVLLGYLILDLKVCHGPLHDALRNRREAAVVEARARGCVALVNQEPLTREQLDLAVERHLFQRGRSVAEVPEKNLAMIRRAVLQSLVDDTLVRQHADGEKFQAPAAERAAFAEGWKAGFRSETELAERAAAQGLEVPQAEAELGRIWSRKRWIEKRIDAAVEVTEEEAKEWYEANREPFHSGEVSYPGLVEPEKVHLRQILLGMDAGPLAQRLHSELRGGAATFDGAAASGKGEDLGWIAIDRLPTEWRAAVDGVGETGICPPFETAHGWHLVEVVERRAERPLTYEEARPEIVAYLDAQRTEEMVERFVEKLRKAANLHLFPENFGGR
ncbi:MAG TPA: peptidyl-prolyl cis-trans isomerase [Bacteroidia bacterium]|nr:peptidyl-prolyl cis-trans isomerase [Bacteroidia bacterium]